MLKNKLVISDFNYYSSGNLFFSHQKRKFYLCNLTFRMLKQIYFNKIFIVICFAMHL